jgi:hypothetical protein
VDIYLDSVRKELEGVFANPYFFLNKKFGSKIVPNSEKNKQLSSLLELSGTNTIYVQTQKQEKQVDEKAIIHQKLEEGKKVKTEVEALITELNAFSKERKDNSAANQAKAE